MKLFRRLFSRKEDEISAVEPRQREDAAALMRRARRLRFRVRASTLSELAGSYTSARRGMGLSFAELKPYEPGDDVRHIDWNVTARQERPYVRRFVEERSLTLWLVIDVSASMRFGPPGKSKADRATQLAALLATSATHAGDRVGILLVSDRIEAQLVPGSGPRHLSRVLRMLISSSSRSKTTSLAPALGLLKTARRRALIILLSDFLFDEPDAPTPWARLARWNRVAAFRIIDPREEALPDAGLIQVEDAESGRRHLADSASRRARAAYGHAAEERSRHFHQWCAQAHIEPVDVLTSEEPLRPLLRFFDSSPRRRS
jgi:uncharacterized protein (DUF58 family)